MSKNKKSTAREEAKVRKGMEKNLKEQFHQAGMFFLKEDENKLVRYVAETCIMAAKRGVNELKF